MKSVLFLLPIRTANFLFVLLWLALHLAPTLSFTPTTLPFRTEGTLVALHATPMSTPMSTPMHRNIIVLSHNVSQNVADGFFDINNLLTGRVDVLARCVNSALWVSNGIRKDTTIFLMLFPHNVTIEIQGEHIRGLNPDERTTALYLQRTLLLGSSKRRMNINMNGAEQGQAHDAQQGQGQGPPIKKTKHENDGRPTTVNPHKPGSRSKSEKRDLRLARKAREAMLRRIHASDNSDVPPQGFKLHLDDTLEGRLAHLKNYSNGPILMLNEIGEPLSDVMMSINKDRQINTDNATTCSTGTGTVTGNAETTTLIIADQIGYDANDEKLLSENKDVTKVSLGPLSLLTSQCITITHHYIDTHRL